MGADRGQLRWALNFDDRPCKKGRGEVTRAVMSEGGFRILLLAGRV